MDKFQQNMEAFHVPIAAIVFIISIILMVVVQIPTPQYLNPFGCLCAIAAMASGFYLAFGILLSIE